MNTKVLRAAIVVIFLANSEECGRSQGTFVNLGFENPILPLVPQYSKIPIANALPGWTGYLGSEQVSFVFYNSVSIGGAAISLHDSASTDRPIHGNYSVILQGQFNPDNVPGLPGAAIAQVGQIPPGVASLRFYSGSEYMQVTFGGQSIPLVQVGNSGGYLILSGNVSAFAGQTGELRFTMPSGAYSFNIPYLDNIVFIPEPSAMCLLASGMFAWGWRLRRRP